MEDKNQIEELKELINDLTVDSILKGKRPTWVSYEDFKKIRITLKKQIKEYEKGRIFHPVREFLTEENKIIMTKLPGYIKNK